MGWILFQERKDKSLITLIFLFLDEFRYHSICSLSLKDCKKNCKKKRSPKVSPPSPSMTVDRWCWLHSQSRECQSICPLSFPPSHECCCLILVVPGSCCCLMILVVFPSFCSYYIDWGWSAIWVVCCLDFSFSVVSREQVWRQIHMRYHERYVLWQRNCARVWQT